MYRILRVFAEMKITETQRAEDGEMLYRLRTTPAHRHYLLAGLVALPVEVIAEADLLHRQRLRLRFGLAPAQEIL